MTCKQIEAFTNILSRIAADLQEMTGELINIEHAIDQQTELLNDVVCYPADLGEPPRLQIGVRGAVEVIED